MIKFCPTEKFPLLQSYLERDEEVLLAYLFGSCAAEKAGKLSDIDIAILLSEGTDFLEKRLSLLADITSILKTDEVDLVILNHAPISFQYRVIKAGKLLVSKGEELKENYHKIKAMVGLRNILVYEYLEIDPAQIYHHLQKVSDFQEYARHIVYFVEKELHHY